jgi:pimeloyl-ACP methyl ester carboxylesterase
MKTSISCVMILLLVFTALTEGQTNYGSNKSVGKYANVNGIKVYYEIYGKGEPLLLLHGNGGSINSLLFQIPELSKYFKVIAVDSRAQGNSTDSEEEISYALMASDMKELIDKLNLGSAHVVGWSDGGNIGLELAFQYPEKVKKLVTFGANYSHENFMASPDNVVMDPRDPRLLAVAPLMKKYKEKTDNTSPAVQKKLSELMEKYPNFTVEQLRQINVPVLVVAGDRDAISFDQTISLFTNLPHSQLFIVPGASHMVPIEQPEVVNRAVVKFLTTSYRDLDRYYWMNLLK